MKSLLAGLRTEFAVAESPAEDPAQLELEDQTLRWTRRTNRPTPEPMAEGAKFAVKAEKKTPEAPAMVERYLRLRVQSTTGATKK